MFTTGRQIAKSIQRVRQVPRYTAQWTAGVAQLTSRRGHPERFGVLERDPDSGSPIRSCSTPAADWYATTVRARPELGSVPPANVAVDASPIQCHTSWQRPCGSRRARREDSPPSRKPEGNPTCFDESASRASSRAGAYWRGPLPCSVFYLAARSLRPAIHRGRTSSSS